MGLALTPMYVDEFDNNNNNNKKITSYSAYKKISLQHTYTIEYKRSTHFDNITLMKFSTFSKPSAGTNI